MGGNIGPGVKKQPNPGAEKGVTVPEAAASTRPEKKNGNKCKVKHVGGACENRKGAFKVKVWLQRNTGDGSNTGGEKLEQEREIAFPLSAQ